MNVFCENFDFQSLTFIFRNKKYINNVFYIDKTIFSNLYIKSFKFFYPLKISKLEIKLIEIIDKDGELFRLKLDRQILFDIQDQIIKKGF